MSRPRLAGRPARRRLPPGTVPFIVILWALGTGYAWWSLALQDRRLLDRDADARYFDLATTAPAAEAWLRRSGSGAGVRATVVHLTADACSCDRSVEAHRRRIESVYSARRVVFTRAQPDWVKAFPAVAVFDGVGKLVYFGPYSDQSECASVARGFVERTLDAVLAGRAPLVTAPFGIGCFCTRPTRV